MIIIKGSVIISESGDRKGTAKRGYEATAGRKRLAVNLS